MREEELLYLQNILVVLDSAENCFYIACASSVWVGKRSYGQKLSNFKGATWKVWLITYIWKANSVFENGSNLHVKTKEVTVFVLKNKEVMTLKSTKEPWKPWSVFKGVRHQKFLAHLVITFSTVAMLPCWVLLAFPSMKIIRKNSKEDRVIFSCIN